MSSCRCGPFPVRPQPGMVCATCGEFIVGPPKENRRTDLHQTQHPPAKGRRLNGVLGRRRRVKTIRRGQIREHRLKVNDAQLKGAATEKERKALKKERVRIEAEYPARGVSFRKEAA